MVRIHLARLLGERKMKQKQLADMTGIRPTTISEYYHEMVERVTLKHISDICLALGCKAGDLLEVLPDEESPPKDAGT